MSYPTISSSKVEGTTVYNLQGDKLGSIDDLLGFARTHRVDMLIVALPVTAEQIVGWASA